MNLIPAHPGSRPARPSNWTRLLTGVLLLSGLAVSVSAGDMFRPRPLPGGIDPHPWFTGVARHGTNTTLSWYGLEGTYHVQTAPSLSGSSGSNLLDLVATDYAWTLSFPNPGNQGYFRLNPDNGYLGARSCSSCHSDTYAGWQRTQHAGALSVLNGVPPSEVQNCLVCHTVGYGQSTGFVSTNATPDLAGVGCESCHGPGAAHEYGDHAAVHPAYTVAAETCGGCHNGARYPTYSEWTNSAHATVTPDVASGFDDSPSGQSRMMNCGPCHSGAVRVAMLDNYKQMLKGYTNVLALPSGNDAHSFGQTCSVCHDPHYTNGPPYQLRNPITSTNFYTFVTGAATNRNGQYLNTVFATQYVASVQICAQCHNSRGASWTSTSRPPHHSVQYNIFLGNVGELADGSTPNLPYPHGVVVTNQCVTCHMQQSAYVSEQQPAVTGHSFKVESHDICGTCHSDGEAAFELATNITLMEIQEVKAALDYWAVTKAPPALQSKYGARAWEYTTPGELSPGGPGPSASEQALLPVNIQKARYNLYLVYNDGSMGVHNPYFTIHLLTTAYNWVGQEVNP